MKQQPHSLDLYGDVIKTFQEEEGLEQCEESKGRATYRELH